QRGIEESVGGCGGGRPSGCGPGGRHGGGSFSSLRPPWRPARTRGTGLPLDRDARRNPGETLARENERSWHPGGVSGDDARALRALLPLGVVSAVVVLVTLGLSRGLWPSNLHNGLLALAFTGVGAYVLHQRPGHLIGNVFLATGMVEAVMFLGRQQAHHDGSV